MYRSKEQKNKAIAQGAAQENVENLLSLGGPGRQGLGREPMNKRPVLALSLERKREEGNLGLPRSPGE